MPQARRSDESHFKEGAVRLAGGHSNRSALERTHRDLSVSRATDLVIDTGPPANTGRDDRTTAPDPVNRCALGSVV